jgi:hypothetical protein
LKPLLTALRKTIAILLLTIHAFNIAGYHFIFNYYKHKTGSQAEQKIERGQFLANDLVEVNIPYSIPYASSRLISDQFDGEIEVNGVTFNYVSLRLINDTLHLRCLPNTEMTRLNASGNEIAKQWSHASGTEKKSDNTGSQKAISEYNEIAAHWTLPSPQHFNSKYNLNPLPATNAGFYFELLQPPRA